MKQITKLIFSHKGIAIAVASLITYSCSTKPVNQISDPVFIEYAVRSSFPHDRNAFTQGLVIYKGELYESTGQENSYIGIIDIKTGVPDKKIILDKKYFGEGITILNSKLYQLTWEHNEGFVYSLDNFKLLQSFQYQTEGWGLTNDGTNLIMSDGTSSLYFLDTIDFKVQRKMEVSYQGVSVNALNELEYVDGFIFANIWRTNWIAKIDPTTGNISGFLDLTPLAQQAKLLNPNVDVLNGIAWHNATQLLLVTGKYWPYIYALKLQDPV